MTSKQRQTPDRTAVVHHRYTTHTARWYETLRLPGLEAILNRHNGYDRYSQGVKVDRKGAQSGNPISFLHLVLLVLTSRFEAPPHVRKFHDTSRTMLGRHMPPSASERGEHV